MQGNLPAFLAAVLLAVMPLPAHAQGVDEGLILRIDGDVTVISIETVDSAIIVTCNAFVEGTITDLLVIADGTATIRGTVDGNITVIERWSESCASPYRAWRTIQTTWRLSSSRFSIVTSRFSWSYSRGANRDAQRWPGP
jgi:hypothetical protein